MNDERRRQRTWQSATDGSGNDERPREEGEDSETSSELGEIDDEIEEQGAHGARLGLVGQLVATLGIAAVLGLLILGALALLSWLFT